METSRPSDEMPKRKAGCPNWHKGGPSPNPGGRPKADYLIRDLARSKTPEAFNKIIHLMNNSKDEQVVLKAALAIIERGYGKPIQPLEGGGDIHNHVTYVWADGQNHRDSLLAAISPNGHS